MKLKQLEIALQRCPIFPKPDAALEQYLTPAPIAAGVLYWALAEGDVEGRRVLDLGCGTGVLAVGAAMLGAESATGIDIDREALSLARGFSHSSRVRVDFIAAEAKKLPLRDGVMFDTIIMNPPFGAQNKHADRPFVEAACRHSKYFYSFHRAGTEDFVKLLAGKLGGEVLGVKTYKFEIPHTYTFHEKDVQTTDVSVLRIGMAMR